MTNFYPTFTDTKAPIVTLGEAINEWLANDRQGDPRSSAVQLVGDNRLGSVRSREVGEDGREYFVIAPIMNLSFGWDEGCTSMGFLPEGLRPIDLSEYFNLAKS